MAAIEIRKAQALELKAAKEKGSSFLNPHPLCPPPFPTSSNPLRQIDPRVTSLLRSAGQRR